MVRRLDDSRHEDLQESEASDIYVKRFKSREVFVKGEYEFPCENGTLRLLHRPRPPSIAAGNLEPEDDVEIEESDKRRRNSEDSCSMSGEFIYRHHGEPRLKFYDPDY